MSQGGSTFEDMEPTVAVVLVTAIAAVASAGVIASQRVRRSDGGNQQSRLAALDARLEERSRQLEEVRAERDRARAELDGVRAELAALQSEEAEHRARAAELEKARSQLDTKFKGIAADVLKDNSEELLKQIEARQKLSEADLQGRQQAINGMIKPVGEQLAKLEQQVNELDRKREGAYQTLSQQVVDLKDVAGGLRDVLKSSSGRGQWGEQHLRNVLELAGLQDRCDFEEQSTVSGGEGALRPDVVVRLPRGAKVVIDAKTPLQSYQRACEAQDAETRDHNLRCHAESLLSHAKLLGSKAYSGVVTSSLDFVVMYVPSDPILDAAVDVRPGLWDDVWRKHRVLIASPGLLIALLRTVALAWQQQDMRDNAKEIAEIGRDLFSSLKTYAKNVNKLGNGLRQAVGAYNDSVGTLESSLLRRARALTELGAVPSNDEIDQPNLVETNVRPLTKLELASASDSDALSA